MQYRVQKKQDPLNIDLSCKVENYKDIQKKFFTFYFQN